MNARMLIRIGVIAVAFVALSGTRDMLAGEGTAPAKLSQVKWDFEDGTLEGWTVVNGNLGKQPSSNDNDRWNGNFNKHGKHFVGTFEDGAKPLGDQVTSELRSPVLSPGQRGLFGADDGRPPERIEVLTRHAMREGSPGGGYVLMSSNAIHSGMPWEHYRVMNETWKKFGTVSGKP